MATNIKLFNEINDFFSRLQKVFGGKLIIFLTSVFLLQEGFIFSLVYLNQLPYLKDVLKVNETTYQIFFLVSLSPWSMKSFFGAISDLFPLFGYHKASYMFLSGLLGTIALVVLAMVEIKQSFIILAPAMVFVVMMELSIMDLLCEGCYSKILFDEKIEEGDIITWVWICRMIGQLMGGSIIGVLVTNFHPRYVYWICFAFSFPTLFLLLAGFLRDPFVSDWYREFNVEKFRKQKKLFYISLFIALSAVGIIVVSLVQVNALMLTYTSVMSVVLILLGFLFLPRPLAKCNLYIFLQEALYLRIMGALDYWFTADAQCVPGGPHFDMTFYLTISQIIASISSIIGILIFQAYTKSWTFRFAFIFSLLVRVLGSLFDLFIISRENLRWGLSDKMVFLFGDSIIVDMAYMLARMPAILLTSRLVNRGYESTIYAILAGFHDMGKGVSMTLGTSLMMYLKIDFETRPCQYEKITLLIIISHLVLPMLALPFIYLLIPDIRLGDVSAFDEYKIDESYGDISHTESWGTSDEIEITGDVVQISENGIPRRRSVNSE